MATLPGCIGFGMHAQWGVQFYSQQGLPLQNDPDWTTFTIDAPAPQMQPGMNQSQQMPGQPMQPGMNAPTGQHYPQM